MFGNLDATLNQAFQERGLNLDGVPSGAPQQGQGNGGGNLPFMQGGGQQTAMATSPQATMALPQAAGQLVAKVASSGVIQKVKNGLPIVATGLAAGAIALGAIYLTRRLEHGPAKKDEQHLRLDASTIAPVVAAVVIGVIVILVLRKIRDMTDSISTAQMLAAMSQPSAAVPQFAPQQGPVSMDPVEQELMNAQALMAGMNRIMTSSKFSALQRELKA
jgi:hypothetical protein